MQSEINSSFKKANDSNSVGKDRVTHISTNSLFTSLLFLLLNSVLPPTVTDTTSIFQ